MQEVVDIVTQLISSVGFPIAVAIWCLYINHKDSNDMRETIEKMSNNIEQNNMLIQTIINKDDK